MESAARECLLLLASMESATRKRLLLLASMESAARKRLLLLASKETSTRKHFTLVHLVIGCNLIFHIHILHRIILLHICYILHSCRLDRINHHLILLDVDEVLDLLDLASHSQTKIENATLFIKRVMPIIVSQELLNNVCDLVRIVKFLHG